MLKPLPERLVTELTAHRTLALREAVRRSPDVALTRLPMKLITDTFQSTGASEICLEASVCEVYMSAQATDLKASPVAQAVAERYVARPNSRRISRPSGRVAAGRWVNITKRPQFAEEFGVSGALSQIASRILAARELLRPHGRPANEA